MNAGSVHTVRPGDNLSRILGTSDPQALGNAMRANGMKNSDLAVGRNVFVPADSALYGDQTARGQGALNTDNARLQAIADARARAAAEDLARHMAAAPSVPLASLDGGAAWGPPSPGSFLAMGGMSSMNDVAFRSPAPAPEVIDLQHDEVSYFAAEGSTPGPLTRALTRWSEDVHLGTRLGGALEVVGGAGEVGAGSGLWVAGGATSLAGGVGVPAMALGGLLVLGGVDHVQTGIRTVWTGESQQTWESMQLQAAGLTPQEAGYVDLGVNGLGSVLAGGWLQAGRGLPAYAPGGAGAIAGEGIASSGMRPLTTEEMENAWGAGPASQVRVVTFQRTDLAVHLSAETGEGAVYVVAEGERHQVGVISVVDGSPQFYLDNRVVNSTGESIKLSLDGGSMTRAALEDTISAYKGVYGVAPPSLPGSLADSNLANFQYEFQQAKFANPSLTDQAAGDLAIRNISFGSARAAVGYGNISTIIGSYNPFGVPTRVTVNALPSF